MEQITTLIVAVIAAVTSSGVCSIILYKMQRADKKKDGESEAMKLQSDMLLGLGHDRIVYLGGQFIARGSITQDEYENQHDYLYKPYLALGGNGTAKKIMAEVERLPLTTAHTRKGGGKNEN